MSFCYLDLFFFQTGFFTCFLLFISFLFSLNNVCMVAILIILIMFVLNIETAVQFLTMKF